jgi:hypothetical protein
MVAIAVLLGGCAAADPTGGAFGKQADNYGEDGGTRTVQRSRCPAGEMLTCELKSPHRVSDGRYGFRHGRQKTCGCQPESIVKDLGQATLPRDSR